MKAIMMSIRPQYVAKILNKEKTIEIRKKFPKDYVGWVYIYCTKSGEVFKNSDNHYSAYKNRSKRIYKGRLSNCAVVARFWCDKVVEFYDFDDDLCKKACLDRGEMLDYLGNKNGTAIHISDLEIFDKPKEISEFRHFVKYWKCIDEPYSHYACVEELVSLEKAPQSYMFIEV